MFFGGRQDNYDLSLETGRWVSEYAPRGQYDVIPIHVTPDLRWQVPLGNLPRQGGVSRVLEMLMATVPALPIAQALPRLLTREPEVFFTVLRGRGGDDGSIQQLAETVGAAAVGPSAAICLTTSDKKAGAQAIEQLALAPFTTTVAQSRPAMEAAVEVAADFHSAVFIKPAVAEGSSGVRRVEMATELPGAIAAAQEHGDVLVQEARPGKEITVTVYQDQLGNIHVLPPTIIHNLKAPFFDSLAKRRPGRVKLVTGDEQDAVIRRAAHLAREVYELLGGQGVLTIDMIAHGNNIDVLEVNTVPVASAQTPLTHQLRAAGVHPTTFVDSLVRGALTRR